MRIKRPDIKFNEINIDKLIKLDPSKLNYNIKMLEDRVTKLANLSLNAWKEDKIIAAKYFANVLKQLENTIEFYKEYKFKAIEWAPIYKKEAKERLKELKPPTTNL